MKKKIVLSVVMVAVLVAAIALVIVLKNNTDTSGKTESYSSIEEANEAADFNLEGSDRLCGYPATDYEANSSSVKTIYADAGYIIKTLGDIDSSGGKDYSESTEQTVDGRRVTFKGKDGKVYLAAWNENNFTYTISVNDGVSASEMTEYVKATR